MAASGLTDRKQAAPIPRPPRHTIRVRHPFRNKKTFSPPTKATDSLLSEDCANKEKHAFPRRTRGTGLKHSTASGTAPAKVADAERGLRIENTRFRNWSAARKPVSHMVETTAPPSSRMFCPTIKPACIEQRNAQAAPNSAVVP